jgi:hypothetical protein
MTQSNMLAPLQNMPMPQQNMQQGQLLTGKNPNPKFPRARHGWETFKKGLGNFLQGTKEFAVGTPDTVEQYSTVNPQQQAILQLLQQLGIQGLQNPYAGFEPIAQQAQNQFNQQTVPTLAERFSSLGSNNISSPAFASQLGQAGAGLSTDLAAMQSGYGQQNIQQLLQMLQLGLQPQSENIFRPGQPGVLQGLLGNAGNIYQQYQIGNALKSLTR